MAKFNFGDETFGMDSRRKAKSTSRASEQDTVVESGIMRNRETSSEARNSVSERALTQTGTVAKPQQKTARGAVKEPKMQITSIRFTPENHRYVRMEAAMRGMTVIDFVNWLVDRYKADPKNVHSSGVYKDEDTWD